MSVVAQVRVEGNVSPPAHILLRGIFGTCIDEELMQEQDDREARLRSLADRLEFRVEKIGTHFRLRRTSDVSRPVCEDDLTLAEAEELLNTWKLRGLQGG